MPTNTMTVDAATQFHHLQSQLRDRWQSINIFDQDDYDILVVPSFSIDQKVGQKIPGFLHYEERLLFSLIRLRNPHTRLIYVTACPLAPMVVDYYLQLLPGIPFSHARDRLLLLTTYDRSYKPLTQKILERPRLVERIRNALRPDKAYIVCFNCTPLEQELSLQLGIPLLASSPELQYWGSKSGSREIFTTAQLPHPDGSPLVHSVPDLTTVAAQLWQRQPQLQRMVIKLNEGFSGEGNAILNLPCLEADNCDLTNSDLTNGDLTRRENAISATLPQLSFQAVGETWETFSARISELGAIAEAFIEGQTKRSPSVQGYITPSGHVHILSTHDQILGGPDGQVYLGCRFPADDAYRLQLQTLGRQVGEILAQKGTLERFGVDFIAVHQPGQTPEWDLQAIEINLRKGGTTHPFMTLKYLTSGDYDESTGLFHSVPGPEKYYIASDNLQKDQYRGLLPNDLMDIIATHRLHFDSSTKTGTVFHLMGALSEFGKLGLTSIGNSRQQAEEIFDQVKAVLDLETDPRQLLMSSRRSPCLPMAWPHHSNVLKSTGPQ